MEITSTDAQNNFGQYIKLARYEDIIVTKNGKKVVIIKHYDNEAESDSISERADTYNRGAFKITYEEFLKLSDNGENRYEYIDGEVHLLASPSFDHQKIVMDLSYIMYQWFKGKKCRPLTAPLDVTLTRKKDDNKNVVQPDLLVICDTDKINDNGRYTGVPSLVVEVLSNTTRSKDMLKKLDLYLESCISEYWIVNPSSKEVYLYSFRENDIADYKVFKEQDILQSIYFEGFSFPVKNLFV